MSEESKPPDDPAPLHRIVMQLQRIADALEIIASDGKRSKPEPPGVRGNFG